MLNPPVKRVRTDDDLIKFKSSPSYSLINSYAERMCLIIRGHLAAPVPPFEPGVESMLKVLDTVMKEVDRIHPIEQPMRFGNKAFRTLHAFLSDNMAETLQESGIDDQNVVLEVTPYLIDSFGNSTRLDYGTGHEASFFFALIILMEKRVLPQSISVVLVVFRKYIELVRIITTKYVMEPAGSHGVWGLDDYHHLPFLFGAAQLIGREVDTVKPSEILDKAHLIRGDSLFADCIEFIKNTKGKFARFENVSPLLSDLVKKENWSHVCMSLMRMYNTEVLGKRPIVQHFLFGDTLSWT